MQSALYKQGLFWDGQLPTQELQLPQKPILCLHISWHERLSKLSARGLSKQSFPA